MRVLREFALVFAVAAQLAGAQQIRGVVRDSASALPIPGAVVAVIDAAGRQRSRSITDERGQYHLAADGAVRLQVLRIGFRPRDIVVQRAPGDIVIDVSMLPVPQMIDGMLITDRTSCPSSTHGAAAVALWEQARAGLLATVVAREAAPAQVRTLIFDRDLDPKTSVLVSQTAHSRTGQSNRPFIAARSAAEFVTRGYLIEDPTGRTFEAPDAEVLLDPSFAGSHCFTVRDGDRTHPNEIGLEFRPARSVDSLVDVTGTLWMAREPLALRTLEFKYTNLEPAAERIGSGGLLSFAELRPGIVFIDRWYLRLAGITMTRGADDPGDRFYGGRATRWRTEVTQLQESGGRLVSARWPDGVHWEASMARITGTIVERGTTKPVAGALVWLEGATDSTRTDAAGTFTFDHVLAGPWIVSANNEQFPQYGLSQRTSARVTAETAQTDSVHLAFAPLTDWLGEVCQDQPAARPNTSIILGQVFMPDGSLASQASIHAHWITELSQNSSGAVYAGTTSRDLQTANNGSFHLCGVERAHTIILTVRHPGADSTIVRRELGLQEPIGLVTIHLPAVGAAGEKANPAAQPDRPPRR
jgi:hypothetical protein